MELDVCMTDGGNGAHHHLEESFDLLLRVIHGVHGAGKIKSHRLSTGSPRLLSRIDR